MTDRDKQIREQITEIRQMASNMGLLLVPRLNIEPGKTTCPQCGCKFKDPGRAKGGRKSKRTLSKADIQKMIDGRAIK